MWRDATHLVPFVHAGIALLQVKSDAPLDVYKDGKPCGEVQVSAGVGVSVLPKAEGSFVLDVRDRASGRSVVGSPVAVRAGGWKGVVQEVAGRFVRGFATDTSDLASDVSVVAFGQSGVLAFATAKADQGGAFVLVLPDIQEAGDVTIGIVGSDCVLEGWHVTTGLRSTGSARRTVRRVAVRPLTVAIKTSTPSLKVAHEWGDHHFANSLKSSFDRIGIAASVDTADVWYDRSREADVVLSLRGRHAAKTDPSKINLLWIISHPDRIPFEELSRFDHIFVASDIYAKTLLRQGCGAVSVLHQATDQHIFKPAPLAQRQPKCLFVGNSRREYRTMIRWCIKAEVPLDLYGGLWEGLVPPDLVKATNIPNAELPSYYGGYLILLNDHWDTMRDNGFASNRLFDGSAVGTPIITDAVEGLSEVFGDTINVARSDEELKSIVTACLDDPVPFLRRAEEARQIVLARHTFDHRASEILAMVERISVKRQST